MPVEQSLDPAKRRVVATVSGEFSLEEILAAISGAVSDPAFEPGFDIYSDHTAVTRALTVEQMRATVRHLETLAELLGGARWAVVASSPASWGMMRMLAAHAESIPLDVRVFGSAAEAEAWLASPRPAAGTP